MMNLQTCNHELLHYVLGCIIDIFLEYQEGAGQLLLHFLGRVRQLLLRTGERCSRTSTEFHFTNGESEAQRD